MRLALLYDDPVSLVGGRLLMRRGHGVRVDALAEHFGEVIVCNPVAGFEFPEARYALRARNVSLQGLPYFATVAGGLSAWPGCARALWRASRRWDLLHVVLPNVVGILGYLCARRRGIPVVLAIQGDLAEQYERHTYRGPARVAAAIGVALFERATRWMARHALTITQGDALARKYARGGGRIVSIPWSPVTRDAIVSRADTCRGPQIKVLFVGSLVERKGIFVLLEAVRIARRSLGTLTARYVGSGRLRAELVRRVADSGLADCVEVTGGVYDETALWQEYDAADLFVFPTYGEGFPRVVFEAMARGLPVVASRVSGIPGVVRDGRDALLVEPGSPGAVADAIVRIVRDADVRGCLIRHGRKLVEGYTLETTTRQRVDAIRSAHGIPG